MTRPHYLLFSETSHDSALRSAPKGAMGGRWKFVLESIDGAEQLEAGDSEEDLSRERLELLSVVRGLEALPQPSRVTLITTSRYVSRGMRFGLTEWRENGWQWEHFGQMSAVANADLWQRLDAALRIHDVRFRTLRFDGPHAGLDGGHVEPAVCGAAQRSNRSRAGCASRAGHWVRGWLRRSPVRVAQLL